MPTWKPLPLFLASRAGGWLNTTVMVPAAIKAQLAARAKAYPIPWTEAEAKATWLVQSRLLMFPFIAGAHDSTPVQIVIDGTPVTVAKSYNSRGLQHSRTFLGHYYDASGLLDEADATTHTLAVNVPANVDFQGVFWENVETVYTSEVVSC